MDRSTPTLVHLALGLPWALAAVAVVVLTIVDRPNGPMVLATIPLLATAAALFLARGWWLVGAAILCTLSSLFGLVGVGLNYIDHTPVDPLARVAHASITPLAWAGILASVVAVAFGLLERRATRTQR